MIISVELVKPCCVLSLEHYYPSAGESLPVKALKAQNEELKRLLADVRSAVVRHLEEAKKLKASLGRKK